MTQMFYPEPGDMIICKGRCRYVCVAKENYKHSNFHHDSVIYGVNPENHNDQMCWKRHDGKSQYFDKFDIVEIQKNTVSCETYTAGQVVRAVQSLGIDVAMTDILIALKYADDPDYKTFRELKKKFEGV